MQNDLIKYYSWCNFNRLSLNIKKTIYVIFSNRRRNNNNQSMNLYLADSKLESVNQFLYLGINLDTKLNFQLHFNKVLSTIQDKVYLLAKLRRYITKFAAVVVYKAHLLSYIEYGSMLLNEVPINKLIKLQRTQNKCHRICLKADRYSSNFELHTQCNILPLRLRENHRCVNICLTK